jgi:hypothetical protein
MADKYAEYIDEFQKPQSQGGHTQFCTEVDELKRAADGSKFIVTVREATSCDAEWDQAAVFRAFESSDRPPAAQRTIECDVVILAHGMWAQNSPKHFVENVANLSIPYDQLDQYGAEEFEGKSVVIFGGGNAAFETADALRPYASDLAVVFRYNPVQPTTGDYPLNRVLPRMMFDTGYVGDVRGPRLATSDSARIKSLDGLVRLVNLQISERTRPNTVQGSILLEGPPRYALVPCGRSRDFAEAREGGAAARRDTRGVALERERLAALEVQLHGLTAGGVAGVDLAALAGWQANLTATRHALAQQGAGRGVVTPAGGPVCVFSIAHKLPGAPVLLAWADRDYRAVRAAKAAFPTSVVVQPAEQARFVEVLGSHPGAIKGGESVASADVLTIPRGDLLETTPAQREILSDLLEINHGISDAPLAGDLRKAFDVSILATGWRMERAFLSDELRALVTMKRRRKVLDADSGDTWYADAGERYPELTPAYEAPGCPNLFFAGANTHGLDRWRYQASGGFAHGYRFSQ